MIKLTITVKDGRILCETDGKMVTGRDIAGLFKGAGRLLGHLMRDLPHEACVEAVDALMSGMEEAKQEQSPAKE